MLYNDRYIFFVEFCTLCKSLPAAFQYSTPRTDMWFSCCQNDGNQGGAEATLLQLQLESQRSTAPDAEDVLAECDGREQRQDPGFLEAHQRLEREGHCGTVHHPKNTVCPPVPEDADTGGGDNTTGKQGKLYCWILGHERGSRVHADISNICGFS
jgi:hypothetical protein